MSSSLGKKLTKCELRHCPLPLKTKVHNCCFLTPPGMQRAGLQQLRFYLSGSDPFAPSSPVEAAAAAEPCSLQRTNWEEIASPSLRHTQSPSQGVAEGSPSRRGKIWLILTPKEIEAFLVSSFSTGASMACYSLSQSFLKLLTPSLAKPLVLWPKNMPSFKETATWGSTVQKGLCSNIHTLKGPEVPCRWTSWWQLGTSAAGFVQGEVLFKKNNLAPLTVIEIEGWEAKCRSKLISGLFPIIGTYCLWPQWHICISLSVV